MIAKRIPKKSGGKGLAALGRYVLRETGSPASWRRQAEYANDLARGGEAGPKVEWVSVTNCGAVRDPGRAIQLMDATRLQNPRVREGGKTETGYHLVISFEPGEKPDRATMTKIEEDLISAIGLGEHQRISAAHQDKDHFHVHVVVNLIHPITFLKNEPYYDKSRLMEKCTELEVELGLNRTNHGELQPVFEVEVKDRAGADLVRAAEAGLGWQNFHQAAAAHGLRVRRLGGGITLARADHTRFRLKASAVDRGLSLAKLSARFGPWEEASAEVLAGLRQWDRSASRPAQPPKGRPTRENTGAEGGLYGRFQSDQSAARAARMAVLQVAKAEHQRWRSEWQRYHRDRVGRAWEGTGSAEARRAEAERRKAERDQAKRDRGVRVLEDTAAISHANPIPTWLEWLEARASEGEAEAISALRRRGRLAGIGSPEQAHQPRAMEYLRPYRRKDGSLAYTVADGGRVTDRGSVVEIERVSDGSSALALRIAAERYGLKDALVVTGTDMVRASLADMAGRDGLALHFADPALEARRIKAGGRDLPTLQRLAAARASREAFRADREARLDLGRTRDRGRDGGRGRD